MLKLYIIPSVFLVTVMKKNYRLIFATIISLSLINCGGSENVTNEENTEQKVETAAPFEKKPQTVIIPNTNVSISNDSSSEKSIASNGTVKMIPYTIKPGDSLSQIALDNNTTVEEIAKINKITDTYKILVDQVILIPTNAPDEKNDTEPEKQPATQESSSETKTYTVKGGDSGYTIALDHGITLEKFAEINDKTIEELNVLYVGDEVLVPR